MARKWLTATVTAALCMGAVTPALAQDYRFTGFNAPQGASATVNLRIPLTQVPWQRQRPTFGFTMGLGRSSASPDLDGRIVTRSANFADIRFTGDGELQQARLASFDLANLDQDRRLNMMGGTGTFTLIGIVATGVAVCWLIADCFGDDDDEDEDDN
jgi:hypothetical protein